MCQCMHVRTLDKYAQECMEMCERAERRTISNWLTGYKIKHNLSTQSSHLNWSASWDEFLLKKSFSFGIMERHGMSVCAPQTAAVEAHASSVCMCGRRMIHTIENMRCGGSVSSCMLVATARCIYLYTLTDGSWSDR